MNYFEEKSSFAYKVKSNEKFRWRVSVDMGVHSFLLMTLQEAEYLFRLGTHFKPPAKIRDRVESLLLQAIQITSNLDNCELITDECYLANLSPLEKEVTALANELDKGTTYSPAFWQALLEDLKRIEVV